MGRLEELVLILARALVDEPDKVEVSGTETDSRVDLELRVAPDDMGKVIGRGRAHHPRHPHGRQGGLRQARQARQRGGARLGAWSPRTLS